MRSMTADRVISYLAGTMTPTTLAAIIANLADNDPIGQEENAIHDLIGDAMTRQLITIVGEHDAHELIDAA